MPCTQAPSIIGLATAAGIGLLIGLVRERAHAEQTQPIAGLRTPPWLAPSRSGWARRYWWCCWRAWW